MEVFTMFTKSRLNGLFLLAALSLGLSCGTGYAWPWSSKITYEEAYEKPFATSFYPALISTTVTTGVVAAINKFKRNIPVRNFLKIRPFAKYFGLSWATSAYFTKYLAHSELQENGVIHKPWTGGSDISGPKYPNRRAWIGWQGCYDNCKHEPEPQEQSTQE